MLPINANLSIDFLQSRVAWLRKLHPGRTVICAGGAPRDLLNRKPVKDLDFFIQGDAGDFWNVYEELCKEFMVDRGYGYGKGDTQKAASKDFVGCDMENLTLFCGSGYGRGPNYAGFWTVEFTLGWRGYPVQLVYVKNTDDVQTDCMERFDFGLTRLWLDDRRLRLTHDFHDDANNRRLTFYGSGWGETSEDRLKRIRAKYSDWKFRDLSHLREPKKQKVAPTLEIIVEDRSPGELGGAPRATGSTHAFPLLPLIKCPLPAQ